MPLAKIHIGESRYDRARAIQAALINTLRLPSDDFYQLIFELVSAYFFVRDLYEVPSENISFGQGEAQRANAVVRA
jgi:hypothetical protein